MNTLPSNDTAKAATTVQSGSPRTGPAHYYCARFSFNNEFVLRESRKQMLKNGKETAPND